MKRLPKKLRVFKASRRMKILDIAEKVGAKSQAVINWMSEERCPKKLLKKHADKLVELTGGAITLRDCGWK